MRTPFQQRRPPDPASLRARLGVGFAFLRSQRFLFTSAFMFGLSNFTGPGLLLAIVVVGKRQGLASGAVGGLVAVFGAGVLVGSMLSPLVRRRLPARGVLLLELWLWVCCAAFLAWPSVYVLAAGMLPAALAIPSTDSVVHGYRIALTPDRLIGRVQSAWSTISLLIAPLGPLVAGALLATVSARATIAVFAAAALLLAVWATFSPSIRTVPSLADED